MRQSFLILSFCSLLLLGCKKSVTKVDIFKQWTWENSVGGYSGIDTVRPSQNAIITLTFKDDMTYSTAIDGEIISQGNFQIRTINNQTILQASEFTSLDGLWLVNTGEIIEVKNNKLYLIDYEVSEGYTHHFHY